MTRAPPDSVRTTTRKAPALAAIESAISQARSFRSSGAPVMARPTGGSLPDPAPRCAARHAQPGANPRAAPRPGTPGKPAPPPRHAARRAGRGPARIVARMAADVDPATDHLHAHAPAGAARDDDLAARHCGADALHPGEVAFDPQRGRTPAPDLEEVAQRRAAAPVDHGKLGDLLRAE